MFGLTPVTLCGVILYAANRAGIREGQSSGLSQMDALNICKIVRFARSVWPSDLGWNGVVRDLFTPVSLHSSATNFDSKFGPRSECSWRAKPIRAKKLLYNASAVVKS